MWFNQRAWLVAPQKRPGQALHLTIAYLLSAVFFTRMAFANDYTFEFHSSGQSSECVVLVHGLRGSAKAFSEMSEALLAEGFATCLVTYPSTRDSMQILAQKAIGGAIARCRDAGAQKIHWVAHSMGGIVLRVYLQQSQLAELGRVLFLSTPHHGTELVNKFRWSRLFRLINGPAGMALGAAANDFVHTLERPDYEFAVLMSSKSINPLASAFIPGKDDGRVSIESATLEGMKDFMLIPCNHHVIMKNKQAIAQTIAFVRDGTFRRTGEE